MKEITLNINCVCDFSKIHKLCLGYVNYTALLEVIRENGKENEFMNFLVNKLGYKSELRQLYYLMEELVTVYADHVKAVRERHGLVEV